MEELELIHELQRFTTRFDDRVSQAAEALAHAAQQRVRDEALRMNLVYVASAMEIATGAFAEVNLLDMDVFVRLCRSVLETHWIPTLFGDAGRALFEAFVTSEEEISGITDRALSPMRRQHLTHLIDTWLVDNPTQTHVEGIRLSDFASDAASAAADRKLEARGILSGVKTATAAANQALMLSERAMFLLHRMPSVWRLEARLSAREILADSLRKVSKGPDAPITKLAIRSRHLAKTGAVYGGVITAAALIVRWLVRRRRP